MPKFPDFQFDRISFLLGFIAATLFWWVASRFRFLFPRYWGMLKKYIQDLNQQNQAGVEQTMRKEMLRRSQRLHIAAPLFALDEILIEPRLMAPPPVIEPGTTPPVLPITAQVLPYLPDWPELAANLGAPTLSLLQCMQNGSHIAIIGQPGSGKTVALAHLASQFARNDPATGDLQTALPMLLHVLDLDLSASAQQDPQQTLIKAVTSHVNIVTQPQLSRYLNIAFRDMVRKPILLLDGLDELPAEDLNTLTAYLKALLEKLPALQIIATASSEYMDGLGALGFYPIGIATWNHAQKIHFIQRWSELWTGQLLPEVKKHFQAKEVDPLLLNHWLIGDLSFESPLELTLKTWSAYAGDLNGTQLSHLLETYFSRYIPSKTLLPALDQLGYKLINQGKVWMDIDEMEQILSGYLPSAPTAGGEPSAGPSGVDKEGTAPPKAPKVKKKKGDRDAIVTQGERAISAFTNMGILTQHPGSRVRFSNPIFTGYLASLKCTDEEAGAMVSKLDWSIHVQTLRFLAACSANPSWLSQILQETQTPLHRNLMIVARWLNDAPPNTEWRSNVMRSFVNILQNETLPLGSRARVAAAFITSRDPSTPKLFRQLLSSRSAIVRQLAALGCGTLGHPSMLSDILESLVDPEQSVRASACLAISAMPGDTALSALVEILMQGDEESRQAAAEALALNPTEGRQVLEEISAVDDLLSRRAAVFGLVRIKDDWSRKLLEKLAVEDGQWVVRNAAAQALEEYQKPNPYIPKPLVAPSENAWMLTFASKMGLGIRPGHPATDILIAAFKSGTNEEQIAALSYLRNEPSEGVVGIIYRTLYSDQTRLQEPSMLALWWIAMTGFKIPSPTQFGLG